MAYVSKSLYDYKFLIVLRRGFCQVYNDISREVYDALSDILARLRHQKNQKKLIKHIILVFLLYTMV